MYYTASGTITPTGVMVPEAGCGPWPVWTGAEKSRPHRDSIPDCRAHSQSLYRLNYPAHMFVSVIFLKESGWEVMFFI